MKLTTDLTNLGLDVDSSNALCLDHRPKVGGHFLGIVGRIGGLIRYSNPQYSLSTHDGKSLNEHGHMANLEESVVNRGNLPNQV